MPKRLLIDASHPEETRVAVLNGKRLEEFDYETTAKKPLKGNIYLAKITRVEPSLQAAFVDYGGNRHGFLPFTEIHPDYYRIPIADREALIAEEAALKGDPADFEDDGDTDIEVPETPAATDPDASDPDASDEDAVEADSAEDEDETVAGDETDAETAQAEATEPEAAQAEAGDADESAAPAAKAAPKARRSRRKKATEEETEQLEAEVKVDTVGGDEMEDDRRKRAKLLRRYKIQEVIKRRQVILVQVSKEERGNKGAALTTYLSLAGRYCVLMPNTARGGGISRKIANANDRRRLKKIVSELKIPEGMAVIVRTAGSQRSKAEIKRDYEYLLRLWDEIRNNTFESTAPSLIHEEGDLVKRTIRDLYSREMEEILIEGEDGYKAAKAFMKTLMPSHARNVKLYKDEAIPLLQRHQVESQVEAIHSPTVELASGGYLVISPTEALVSIDINSGRATKERHIETTALKTNLEAADEIARQLRLRDLAGLIVIDFIDMEEPRHNREVERRVKEAMKNDRARIQLGRISHFGLMEMSRQRLRPSLIEASTVVCRHCHGTGYIRSSDSSALQVLRVLEEQGIKRGKVSLTVTVHPEVALYLFNQMRERLIDIEQRYGLKVQIRTDDSLVPPEHRLEIISATGEAVEIREEAEADGGRRRRRRPRRGKDAAEERSGESASEAEDKPEQPAAAAKRTAAKDGEDEDKPRRRRRGKRGGRRRSRRGREEGAEMNGVAAEAASEAEDEAQSDSGTEAEAAPAEQPEAEAAEAPTAAEQPAEAAEAAEEETPKPKRRTRRSRSTSSKTAKAKDAAKKADKDSDAAQSEAAPEAEPEAVQAPAEETAPEAAEQAAAEAEKAKPKRRARRSRKKEPAAETPAANGADEATAEAPAPAAAAEATASNGDLTPALVSESPESGGEPLPSSEDNDPDKPKRKGWWNRLGG